MIGIVAALAMLFQPPSAEDMTARMKAQIRADMGLEGAAVPSELDGFAQFMTGTFVAPDGMEERRVSLPDLDEGLSHWVYVQQNTAGGTLVRQLVLRLQRTVDGDIAERPMTLARPARFENVWETPARIIAMELGDVVTDGFAAGCDMIWTLEADAWIGARADSCTTPMLDGAARLTQNGLDLERGGTMTSLVRLRD